MVESSQAQATPDPEPVLEQPFIGIRRLRPGEFTRRESRAVWGLCLIYALGILGLYTALPVLSPYAHSLDGQTDLLVGMAIGAYGLTQTLFQIPFGHLSDRIGRKRAIFFGLVLFSAGGVVAASTDKIGFLILGRLLQGVGAVASAVVSLVADLTRPGIRTQAIARLGVAIGAAFAVGMLVGPFLAHQFGVRFLFWATSVLSLTAAIYLLIAIPAPKHLRPEEKVHAGDLMTILRRKPMLLLDLGTFLLHAAVTVLFVVVPFDLTRQGGLHEVWKVAVPAIVVGLVSMLLTARISDRENRARLILYAGSGFLLAAALVLAFLGDRLSGIIGGTVVFVLGVALLEPALPSRMTHYAVGPHRGTAMGIFHMSQFLGTFTGGLLGGAFLQQGRRPLFLGLAIAVLAWMLTIAKIEERPKLPAV